MSMGVSSHSPFYKMSLASIFLKHKFLHSKFKIHSFSVLVQYIIDGAGVIIMVIIMKLFTFNSIGAIGINLMRSNADALMRNNSFIQILPIILLIDQVIFNICHHKI